VGIVRRMTNASESIQPAWIRPGNIRKYVDLGRSTLYEAIRDGRVKSRVMRKPGNISGPRLVYLPSVLALIESSPEN
jgi:hypothetical protein